MRFNHYQSAVYGEKVFDNESTKWKYDENNDEYTNIILASLKAYSIIFNMHSVQGVDVLIFDDFIHDDHLHWREAMSLGIATALNAVYLGKNTPVWSRDLCSKYLAKVANLLHEVKIIDYPIYTKYGKVCIASS